MPIAAQSNLAAFAGTELERTSFNVVHEYVPADSAPGQRTLPANFKVSPVYRRIVNEMLQQSATFRRQCARIGLEPRVMVTLRSVPKLALQGARAVTRTFRHPSGASVAEIEVPPVQQQVELIAHELEHVIEQIDRVDLPAKAALGDPGVRRIVVEADGVFYETTRAVRAGQKVAHEFYASAPARE